MFFVLIGEIRETCGIDRVGVLADYFFWHGETLRDLEHGRDA